VPVHQHRGIYVADYLILQQLFIFVVFVFFPVILYLSVGPCLQFFHHWVNEISSRRRLCFWCFCWLVSHHWDTWCWFLAWQVEFEMMEIFEKVQERLPWDRLSEFKILMQGMCTQQDKNHWFRCNSQAHS